MFTNVLLEETIEIVLKNVFGRKRKINGLSISDFRDPLKLKTMSAVFYFNGNYYKQLDGVAMGSSSLGPALANAFLCCHESKWLRECFYKRYVNDIFVLLKSENHVNNNNNNNKQETTKEFFSIIRIIILKKGIFY